jgi:hypothetical protein
MIILYRLTTGEDVIGTPVEEDTNETYQALKKPFVLIPMQGQPGQPMQIGFHPYIPYTKDEIIKIKKANIITETKPDTSLLDAYEKNTSSIVTPKTSLITPK